MTMQKAPGHLWIVGLIALVWNGFGAYDYTMSELGNAAYIEAMMNTDPAPIIAWIEAQPWYTHAFWALGVWFGVAGSVLLLMRKGLAVPAFALSLVGAVGGLVIGLTGIGGERPEAMGGSGYNVMMSGIVIFAVALLVYARKQRANGVLV